MIDASRLLADLTRLRADLEDDLRARCGERPDIEASLQQEYRKAVGRERTADTYDAWREERLTQVAVAWILGCVFVRFLEDNALVDPPRLSGPGDRRTRALDEHNLYFRAHPTDTDREYLLHVFRAVAALPVAGQLFDERHNPLWSGRPRAALRRRGDAAAPFVATNRSRLGRPRPRFHGQDPGHALPGGSVPGPFRERAQALRAAPDARVRGGVHPRPHAHARHRGVRFSRSASDRSGLRLGTLPAGRVPASGGAVGAARAGHEPARAGHPRSRTGGGRRPESLRRRDRALPAVRRRA